MPDRDRRLFDLGCGNGSVANALTQQGWEVLGVDPSREGIAQARQAYPHLRLNEGSGYDDLASRYGQFPVVLSLEVIGHVYSPRQYVRTAYELLQTGGHVIIATPYHGYWKNLAMAVAGTMDAHYSPLRDHGQIKFWSMATLGALLAEVGLVDIRFDRLGRVPALAKAMIARAQKP